VAAYWVNCARSGDPNGVGLPAWQPFTDRVQREMRLDERFVMGEVPDRRNVEWVDDYMRMLRKKLADPSPP
jgi:para-nitrobenzyl esterase